MDTFGFQSVMLAEIGCINLVASFERFMHIYLRVIENFAKKKEARLSDELV